MDAEIISIGTELTQGLTVDTNAAWLSTRLAAIGVTVRRHVTVPDRRSAIRDAVGAACTAQVVLVSGGLGPTADDLTRESLADAVGRLIDDPDRRRQLGEQGRAVALRRYHISTVSRSYEALYEEMIGS